jgi:hypothetical protein
VGCLLSSEREREKERERDEREIQIDMCMFSQLTQYKYIYIYIYEYVCIYGGFCIFRKKHFVAQVFDIIHHMHDFVILVSSLGNSDGSLTLTCIHVLCVCQVYKPSVTNWRPTMCLIRQKLCSWIFGTCILSILVFFINIWTNSLMKTTFHSHVCKTPL